MSDFEVEITSVLLPIDDRHWAARGSMRGVSELTQALAEVA